MRKRVYLALFLSVILIVLATFTRIGQSEEKLGTLSVVERGEEIFFNDDLENPSRNTEQEVENLSNTDLISRQLFTDYISLSASGQATPQTLNSLANKYVEAIPALAVAEQFSFEEFKTVANTEANLSHYAETIAKIYSNYAQTLLGIQSGNNLALLFSSGTGEVPRKMRDIYHDTAYKLKNLSVPTVLAKSHITLANLYLENASAMDSLAQTQADPAKAFAGLLMINENINKEAELLIKIEQTLTSNGI